MFDFIRGLFKPRRSFWVFVITDDYLLGYHATSMYERALTSGCTYDKLNKLEVLRRWNPGDFQNGFISSPDNVKSVIVGLFQENGLNNCYKHSATVIFPKTTSSVHMKFIVDVLKDQGFKEVNVYNPEVEISSPSKRTMTLEERLSFVERLKHTALIDEYPLYWDGIAYDLLANEDLNYVSLGCIHCGCDIVEINYDMNAIFPNTTGKGTIYICPKCMKQQRHKRRGTYKTAKQ